MKNKESHGSVNRQLKLSTEDILVISSLIAIAGVLIVCFIGLMLNRLYGIRFLGPCASKVYFGIPCPGCGATRALYALLRFNISAALRYNAFVVYFAFVYIIFVVSHILKYLTRGKVRGIRYRNIYIVLAIVVVVVQYILKLTVPYFSV